MEATKKDADTVKANDCALQHIKVFREQVLKGAVADFGEPCQKCIYSDTCKFDWFSVLSPLRKCSNVKISMVVQELSPQQGNIHSGIVKDKDTC